MTTIKADTIYHILTALAAVEAKTATGVLPFSGKTSYNLGRLLRQVTTVHEDYEKARIALVRQFGEKSASGDLEVPTEKLEAFSKELKPVQETEVQITLTPIPEAEVIEIKLPFALKSAMMDVGLIALGDEPAKEVA